MLPLTEQNLFELRQRIWQFVPTERREHVLGVENTAARMASVYLPQKAHKIRAAALLHDVTKALPFEKQLQYCEEFGIILNKYDVDSPAILHAITGAEFAKREFADFIDDEILSAIRWHTTGHDGMTVFESVIYLADVIEATRTHESCCVLREFFWHSLPVTDDTVEQTLHLCRTMVRSFDMTIQRLLEKHLPVCADTVLARSCFLDRLAVLERN